AARVEMGSRHVTKHKIWNVRWEAVMDQIWADFRLGMRGLLKNPGFTLVAVLSLALGIGGNTAIFTLIHQVILRELPVNKPAELAVFGNGDSGGIMGGIDLGAIDMATYDFGKQLEANPGPFTGVAYYSSFPPPVSVRAAAANGQMGQAQQEAVSLVSGSYFPVIGAQPLLGRTILPNDAAVKGEGAVAVVSWHYWQTQLDGSRDALGRTITLNGTAFRVVGVMRRNFYGIRQDVQPIDMWVPVTMSGVPFPGVDLLGPDNFYFLHMFARMHAPGDLKQDKAWLNGQVQNYIRAHAGGQIAPDREQEIRRAGFDLKSGAQGVNTLSGRFGDSLKILMVVVALVLLIACANLANFLLARAASRQRETATRLALGSTRARIVRQSLAETLLLSLAGGIGGLALAFAATRALIAFVVKDSPTSTLDATPDALVLLFTLGVSLVTGLLFGLGPALSSAWSIGRAGAAASLGSGGTRSTTAGKAARFLPRVLVATQVVLSLVLLVGAGLFLRSLNNLESQDLGYDRSHLLMAGFDAEQNGYKAQQAPAMMRTLEEKLAAIPGVQSAALSLTPPISGGSWRESFKPEGYTPKPKESMSPILNRVTGHFFETVGITIVAGRGIGPQDTATSMKAIVINETAAKRYFKGDALGKTITFDDDGLGGPKAPWRVIGVAHDTMVGGPRHTDPEVMAYLPLTQMTGENNFASTIELKTAMDPKAATAELRRAVAAVDPNLALTGIRTTKQAVDGMLVLEEMIGSLTAVFAALALVLAAIGLYGVMSYAVVRRTSEIGIRLALGAQTQAVLWMVMKDALLLLGVGIVIGLPLTFAVTRLVRQQLFGLSPADPAAFAVAIGVVAGMTVLASWLPALRASKVDPMVALRCE
ncbi:MAG TPA: ABC transporter permease, partial [Acidobacteriaceae bacterium]|nr:ABC transporter permease [Acidobacteriaceae bacterium]